MNLSNYIKTTEFNQKKVLFNTLSKEWLPINSSEKTLKESLFLKGQEEQCRNRFLFKSPPYGKFEVVPTWECNLRCGHCCVLHQLKNKDEDLDVNRVVNFIQSYQHKYPESQAHIHFIGGEPLLKAETCLDVLSGLDDATFKITTNGICDIDDVAENLLSKMKQITISLDGPKDEHNKQRKSKENIDPFDKTISNLKAMVRLGWREKLLVQAAVRDNVYTKENKLKYYELLLRIGIPAKNIRFAGIHPTKLEAKPQKNFLDVLKQPNLNLQPCCKFRFMTNFVMDSSNNVYSDYFKIGDSTLLGTLSDDMDVLEKAYRKQIVEGMPALEDSGCKSCPVMGYCWGGCVVGNAIVLNKPSSYCAKDEIIKVVGKLSKDGELVSRSTLSDYSCKR